MAIPQGLQRLHGQGHYGDERGRGRILRISEGVWQAITPTGTRLPVQVTLTRAYQQLLDAWAKDHPGDSDVVGRGGQRR